MLHDSNLQYRYLCAGNQFVVLHFVAAFLPLGLWYKMPLHHNNFFECRNGESDPSYPPFVAPLIEKWGDVRIQKLIDSRKWSCRTQGKCTLSFQEAVECEKKCREKLLSSVPNYYFKAVIEFLDGTKYCISTIMDELRFQFKHMFFEGQPVLVMHGGNNCPGQIVSSRLASNCAKSSKITNGEKGTSTAAKIEEEVIKEAKQMIYTVVMRQGNKMQKIENVKPDQIKSLGAKPLCGKVIREIVRTFASKPNFASSSFPWKADPTVLNELKSFDIEIGDLPDTGRRDSTPSPNEKKKKDQSTSKSSRPSTSILQYFPRVDKAVGGGSASQSPQKRQSTSKTSPNSQKNAQAEKILKKAKTVQATPKAFSFNIEKLESMWADTLEKPNKWRMYCHYADAIVRKRGTVKEFEIIPNEALRRDMLSRLQLRKMRQKIDSMSGEDKKKLINEYKLKRKQLQLEQNKICDDLQVTNGRALPVPSLCIPPEPMSQEDFGEMLSLCAFIHCYRSAFDSFHEYQLNFTDMCKAVASCCDSNFQEANDLLVHLLEAAMQARIVETYEEFHIPLKSITLDIYSASEIARIMLKENNDHYESEDEERKSSVSSDNSDHCFDLTMQSLLEEMVNVEFCELDVKWKIKVLWYLVEMLLRSNVMEEFLRKSYQKFHFALKRKIQLTNELMQMSENNNNPNKGRQMVNNGKLGSFLVDLKDEEEMKKKRRMMVKKEDESCPSKVQTTPKQTLTLRQQDLQEEKVKRQKQKEEREREAARERLKIQLEATDKTIEMIRKFGVKSLNKIAPLGTDRYYNRYWFFGKWLPGLFVEKGCYQCSTFDDNNDEDCSSDAEYQWCHYSTEEQIRELVDRLLDKGERESKLKKAISNCLPEIFASLNGNNNNNNNNRNVELEFDNPVKCMQMRLLDLEQQFTAGHFVQFQDRQEWISQVKKAADLKRLADLLVSLQKMIRPNLLCGYMQLDGLNSKKKSQQPSSADERIAKWQRAVQQAATFSRLFVLLSVFENSVQLYKSTTKARCQTCRRSNDVKCLLLCDACNVACHTFCLRPPLQTVPSVAWLCLSCKRDYSKEKIKSERQENDLFEEREGKTTISDTVRCTRSGKIIMPAQYDVQRLNGGEACNEVQKKCREIFEKIQSSGLSSHLLTVAESTGIVLRRGRTVERLKTLAFVKSQLDNYASLEEFFSDLKAALQNGRTTYRGRKPILRNLDDLEEMIEDLENYYNMDNEYDEQSA
ncbi:Tyrosine-protein kinase BAZ1B [Trichinella sp. T8]|nr:Tyrosine-protein kinase BAZ1B [Trichinella sp. T8]